MSFKKNISKILIISPSLLNFFHSSIDMINDNKNNYYLSNNLDYKIDDWNKKEIIIDFSLFEKTNLDPFKKFDLEIQKEIKYYKNGSNKKTINFKYYKIGKLTDKFQEGIKYNHKGFWIGDMLNDFLKFNQKIIFKNLCLGKSFKYDLYQPDFMLSLLFMIVFKLNFTSIIINYTDPSWFIMNTSISHSYIKNNEELKRFNKLKKKKNGRFELNQEYFILNKNYEKLILERSLKLIFTSNIFDKYKIEDLLKYKFL